VSGDVVILDGPVAGGWAARFVEALKSIVDEIGPESFALIGGLAVMTRLGGAYRVTDDIDTATERMRDEPHSRLFVLTHDAAGLAKPLSGGGKVDCIEVEDVAAIDLDPADLPEEANERAFCVAHRWAFDGAGPVILSANMAADRRIEVQCRVATPAALVAMKLVAIPRRKGVRLEKRSTDLADLFSLLTVGNIRQIADDLRRSPHGLGDWCAQEIRILMVGDATRSAQAIAAGGLPGRVEPADVASAGERFAALLVGDTPAGWTPAS
jgi:hypothetical protein